MNSVAARAVMVVCSASVGCRGQGRPVLEAEHRGEAVALDLGGAGVDGPGDRVAQLLLDAVLGHVAVASEDLYGGERGGDVGLAGDELGDRDVAGDVLSGGHLAGGRVQPVP